MSVVERLNLHYQYAKEQIDEDRIIGLFLVGSQNYGTATDTSDVDTKLLIVPSLDDIYNNKKGESYTFKIPDGSGEQMVVKDIRCVLKEFRKQNLNILEILFTEYKIINPIYKDFWVELEKNKEEIVRYDQISAVKTTKGIALNAYSRLYSQNGEISDKQVANLVRLEYYLKNYINGLPYEECIRPKGKDHDYIMQIRNHELGETALQLIADGSTETIKTLVDAYAKRPDIQISNNTIDIILNETCANFINLALLKEFAAKGLL